MTTYNTSVIGLSKQQMLEIAGDLLLLASDKSDERGVVLRTSTDQVVFCKEEDFSDVCSQLELSEKSTEEDYPMFCLGDSEPEEDTEVHP